MFKYLLLFLFGLPLILKGQGSFIIKGYGKSLKNGDKIFLSYKQGNKIINDSIAVHNSSFEFKGVFETIARGYVCRNDNPKYAAELHDSFDIYIEEGQIVLNSVDTLNNSIISGTPLNNDYAKLIAKLQPVIKKRKSLRDPDKLSADELKNVVLVNKIKEDLIAVLDEYVPIQFDFIAAHPNSYVSLLTLGRLARTSKNLSKVEQYFSRLSPQLKLMPEGKEISNRIGEGKKVKIGTIAKNFTQPDVNGKEINLSDYKGKYLLVDFWASWCLPCREENRNVIATYNRYQSKNFTVLGISIDVFANKENWLKAIMEDNLPWTQVSDLKKENEAAKLYGITTIPANVLIDPSGKIIGKDLKGKELRDKLAALFGY